MGHADISTTRKIYTHLRQKNMEADTKLNNYINKKINKEKQPKLLVNCFFDPLKSIKNTKKQQTWIPILMVLFI